MSERMTHEQAQSRAAKLVAQMSTTEKIQQLENDAPAIKRLHLPEYNYWSEALHGVARAGVATVFPQAIGLSAMFAPAELKKVADVIATEARSKYNEFMRLGDHDIYKGLTYWSPNVNIFRDPRWGRGHETYGEDPYLTSVNGVAFIRGLQGSGRYLKLAACAKHFAVHSGPENLRHGFDAQVSQKDLHETYLPAFHAAVAQGHVESLMMAYNAVNGKPMAVNDDLNQKMLRQQWHFQGHVVSDYGAEEDVLANHHYTLSDAQTMALALKAGCDLCGGKIAHNLNQALASGLITEKEIDTALIRVLGTRILLGLFAEDDPDDAIGFEENDSAAHHQVALEATYKTFVLLKNTGILPLDKTQLKSAAVIGPTADSRTILQGNYNGTASNNVTLLEGLQQALQPEVVVRYAAGCHLYLDRTESLAKADDREAEAVSVAQHSDVVFLCLGLDPSLEGEEGDASNAYASGDKKDLNLPGRQQHLLDTMLRLGKPVILLLTAGSALTLQGAQDNPNLRAILDVWYPGALGGKAAADVVLGKVSPSGKLPITFYQTTAELPPFTDYRMTNRTYRYMQHEALYPFGYGLTYSRVELAKAHYQAGDTDEAAGKVAVDVTNTGRFDIEEVIQVYIQPENCPDAPLHPKLGAFKRVSLAVGECRQVEIVLPMIALTVVDDAGKRYRPTGRQDLFIGVGQPDRRTEELSGVKALKLQI